MNPRPNILWLAVTGLCLGLHLPSGAVSAADPTAAPIAPTAPATVEKPQWIMTINGRTVGTEEFNLYYTERLRQSRGQPSAEMQNQVMSDLINFVLVSDDARQRGVDKQPEVQAGLKLQQDQLLSRLAMQAVAASHQPSDEDLKKAFDTDYAKRSGTEYKTRHILVPSEDEAKAVIKKLEGGTPFADLAKEQTGGSRSEDLGWVDPGDLVPPFAEALKTMKPGTTSKQPVKTDFGWHVILLEETREAKPPTFDEVKAEIVASLKQQAMTQYLTELREKAKIEFNPALTAKPKPADAPGKQATEDKPAAKK
jgi:peptidyl-prolyl cis-trans isomerase C